MFMMVYDVKDKGMHTSLSLLSMHAVEMRKSLDKKNGFLSSTACCENAEEPGQEKWFFEFCIPELFFMTTTVQH